MTRIVMESEEPVTLVATGPLSNVAELITQNPAIVDHLAQIVIMGGAVDLGNWTPAAEFNIWVDPHAADLVFRHGCAAERVPGRVPLTMIGLEVTHQAWLTDEHADLLRGKSPAGTFVAELLDHFVGFHQERFGWEGAPIHDAVTIAHLIDPTLVQLQAMNVQVEVESPLCIGRTVADRWQVTGLPANAEVGLGIDRSRFVDLLMSRLLA